MQHIFNNCIFICLIFSFFREKCCFATLSAVSWPILVAVGRDDTSCHQSKRVCHINKKPCAGSLSKTGIRLIRSLRLPENDYFERCCDLRLARCWRYLAFCLALPEPCAPVIYFFFFAFVFTLLPSVFSLGAPLKFIPFSMMFWKSSIADYSISGGRVLRRSLPLQCHTYRTWQ